MLWMRAPEPSTYITNSYSCWITPTSCSSRWLRLKKHSRRGEFRLLDGLDIWATGHHTEASMKASQHGCQRNSASKSVTNSVTNRLGNPGQCRAIVTNSVTKLRAIQGNEITTSGESRA